MRSSAQPPRPTATALLATPSLAGSSGGAGGGGGKDKKKETQLGLSATKNEDFNKWYQVRAPFEGHIRRGG
jgi:hypothetical protein